MIKSHRPCKKVVEGGAGDAVAERVIACVSRGRTVGELRRSAELRNISRART